MSDQVEVQPSEEPDTECSVCGHVPGPYADCDICHGNKTFVQKRHYTLTETQQGKGDPNEGRYGRTGNVGPKIVSLPGSFTPHQD
jgi:hypothetical protein